ncbi:hypothetical protein EJB05_05128 [Eragrostis curvula]|uniref:Uncharacterized protein n=1 Tax=Eragrostis curvula TaxID=38414 RepID=A0A5J9WCK7_9POAL|nr:hypothetical protein EJB05_05128 [Eragrostis curvula]
MLLFVMEQEKVGTDLAAVLSTDLTSGKQRPRGLACSSCRFNAHQRPPGTLCVWSSRPGAESTLSGLAAVALVLAASFVTLEPEVAASVTG